MTKKIIRNFGISNLVKRLLLCRHHNAQVASSEIEVRNQNQSKKQILN